MNSQLAIIVAIDVEAALNKDTLHGNSYLIDNNRFMGSSGQGSEQLTTMVVGSQILNWLVIGIDLSGQQPFPVLEKIGGEAVDKQIMVPQLFDSPALDGGLGLWWGATVDANVAGKYNYTLYFDISGVKMELVSSIFIQSGFTMLKEFSFNKGSTKAASKGKSNSSLYARVVSDGSISNPDNHVSLITKSQLNKLRSKRKQLLR